MERLTSPQQNIWNLQQYYSESSISNICGAMFFRHRYDSSLVNKAINLLLEDQEGLRLQFRESEGIPMQDPAPFSEGAVPVRFFETREAFDRYALAFGQIPFHLTGEPLYRFEIFYIGTETGVLLCINHLISDAWTVSLIAQTVSRYCEALESGIEPERKAFSYLLFAESERKYLESSRCSKDAQYWMELYPERPEICAVRPGSAPVRNPSAARFTCRVSEKLSADIDRFYEETNLSQAVLFESAMILYLSKINPDQKTVSLGVPVLNRSTVSEKHMAGMCISTMALTVPVEGCETVREFCRLVGSRQFQSFRHEKYPYSHLLQKLHEKYGFSGNLYDVLVSFQNAKTGENVQTEWYSNGCCEIGMEFHIDNRDSESQYRLNIDYQTELFPKEAEICLFVKRILHMVEQMIRNPELTIDALSILPPEERNCLLQQFNDTVAEFPENRCVHELFMEQAEKHPDQVALIFEKQEFTYRQLDEMSNALAYNLRERGIGPGSIVPIIAVRSWHVIVSMLAVLKAGGAYMPVDPTYPTDRIQYMTDLAKCAFALTFGYQEQLKIPAITLENFDFGEHTEPVPNVNTPEDLCYIIFTSGSTGKPKGVSLCHRNVINYATATKINQTVRYVTEHAAKVVSTTNMIFDIFVTESLMPLLNGLTICFANDDQVYSQRKLAEMIQETGADVIQSTPTKMRSYILDREKLSYLKQLKVIILGGEALPADLYHQLAQITDARIYNIYGPAETTVWSTNQWITSAGITIGKPIANTQVYILNSRQGLLPIGVAGELCISGDGVGKGYLNRPDLTAERFIPNPFIPGKIMYRTGDLARWRADGEIEYLGRIDTQVKIRGLRIELGEIENVMGTVKGIQLAAATDKKDDHGRQYLVGYYTAAHPVEDAVLREALGAKLPKYMVPNYFMHLSAMPMTASGKIDRKNLPEPDRTVECREYRAPENATQETLCRILCKLFEEVQISIDADFFELGGDSLRAIEYMAEAHNAGITLALQNVFDYPTVETLSAYLSGGRREFVRYEPDQFEKYRRLLAHNVISDFTPKARSLGNMLLTGATGFLGAHILDQFMRTEKGKLFCVVRGGSERLRSVLEYYFPGAYTEEIGHRIQIVDGDLTEADFAEKLPREVQTVVHTAATVKHYGPYEYFHRINVEGTRKVVSYAEKIGARLIHVSTLSVSGNSLVDAFDVYRSAEPMDFREDTLYIGQPLDNVYIHSKFEAELSVLDAMLEGLDAKIIRVGNLTNRNSDAKFQPNYQSNAFLSRVKACLEFGAIPDYLMELYTEFSPIDSTANGILQIARFAKEQNVFHLNSNENLYFNRMVEILQEMHIPMEVLDGNEFRDRLFKLAKDPATAYIYEAFQNDMDEAGKLIYDSNIHIDNDFTVWFMKKLGFSWPKIDRAYLERYIRYFREIGYLEV